MKIARKFLLSSLVLGFCGAMAFGPASQQFVLGQETEKATEIKPQKTTRKAPRGRIPNGFGKVGVTEKQRSEIYRIQAQYQEEIQNLQDELDELKAREYLEVYDVLTDDQKASLKTMREEASAARKKRAASKE